MANAKQLIENRLHGRKRPQQLNEGFESLSYERYMRIVDELTKTQRVARGFEAEMGSMDYKPQALRIAVAARQDLDKAIARFKQAADSASKGLR